MVKRRAQPDSRAWISQHAGWGRSNDASFRKFVLNLLNFFFVETRPVGKMC